MQLLKVARPTYTCLAAKRLCHVESDFSPRLSRNIEGHSFPTRRSSDLCKQSHDKRYDHENSLSFRPTGRIIVHETTNVKDCSSQVWNRYSELVDTYYLASRHGPTWSGP